MDGDTCCFAIDHGVDRALVELAYDDAWTRQTLADDIDDLESFTSVELAAHARLQDTLNVPDDRPIDLVRNDVSRPED